METFRIMKDGDIPCRVQGVPMIYAIQFEERAEKNHGQSISRLNQRGGLTPLEFYLAAHNLDLSYFYQGKITKAAATKWLEDEFSLLKDLEWITAQFIEFAGEYPELYGEEISKVESIRARHGLK